jgi:hypothetical protein
VAFVQRENWMTKSPEQAGKYHQNQRVFSWQVYVNSVSLQGSNFDWRGENGRMKRVEQE